VLVGEHEYACAPQNLGVDDSGEGGLCDVFYRTWSQRIHRIEFGGAASDEPCSIEDIRPSREVYMNKRAEMFFRARDALNSGQLKGIDTETATELCGIEFDDRKQRLVLMAKKDYKLKFGKSCDLADCAVMCVEVARLLGFKVQAVGESAKAEKESDELWKAGQALYESPGYVEEERPEGVESLL
jgi:hypothetical protein